MKQEKRHSGEFQGKKKMNNADWKKESQQVRNLKHSNKIKSLGEVKMITL